MGVAIANKSFQDSGGYNVYAHTRTQDITKNHATGVSTHPNPTPSVGHACAQIPPLITYPFLATHRYSGTTFIRPLNTNRQPHACTVRMHTSALHTRFQPHTLCAHVSALSKRSQRLTRNVKYMLQ